MGNIQSLPIDSYLDRHPCSGRNITWQYIHTNGFLPPPYSHYPYTFAILSSHCCTKGACTPSWFNREYERYQYANWDGLGDPYNNITNTTIGDWHNGTSNSKTASWNNRYRRPARGGICLGMEPWWWFVQNHWPPLGVDGRPMKNFHQLKWGHLSNGNEHGQQQAVGSNISARSGRLEHRVVTSGAAQSTTIDMWKLATHVLASLKVALWRMGEPMNTLGFFIGILLGYLLCLWTNEGIPRHSKFQLSQLRPLQTEATGPQTNPARDTSTAEFDEKDGESPDTNVASQHNHLQVPSVPIRPQAPRNGASQNSNLQNHSGLTPPTTPPTPPIPAYQNNQSAVRNGSTPRPSRPRFPPQCDESPVTEDQWLRLGTSRRVGNNAASQSSSQPGCRSRSQTIYQQGSSGGSTDSGSQQVGARHRKTRPR